MTDALTIALITSAGGVLTGILGTRGYDKIRNGRHGSNGNGADKALAARAEVEFQTRMTLLMEQLTRAIEKGHDKAVEQMQSVSEAITDAAGAIRQVHEEIVQHRAETKPAVGAVFDVARGVREIRAQLDRNPPHRPAGG